MFFIANWGFLANCMFMNKLKTLLHNIFPKGGVDASEKSVEILKERLSVKLEKAGSLSLSIGEKNNLRIAHLKIEGDLNSNDVGFLRSMTNLETLDLSAANIVVGGDYYIKSLYCQTEDDTIGLYMFHRHAHLRSMVFPRDVRIVRAFAFRRCTALREVHFSDVLEMIGERAFSYCGSLESICFPATLKTIREMAFKHCESLKAMNLPDSVDTIGDYAFADCPSLTSVILSSSLRNLGMEIFAGCTHLSSIHAKGCTPAFAKSSSFDGLNLQSCTLYVPKGTKEKYAEANGWKAFKNIVEE